MNTIIQWLVVYILSILPINGYENQYAVIIHGDNEYEKVLIWNYGGGWAGGSPSLANSYSDTARFYLRNGFTIVQPTYRLTSQGYSWPSQIHDVFATVERVAHEQRVRGYESYIVIGGWSAGGHLSAVAGTAWNSPLNPYEHIRPAYTINMAGPLDPLHWMTTNHSSIPGVMALWNGSPWSMKPLDYADPQDPPMFVGYGHNDDIVPPQYQRQHVEDLKRIIDVTYIETMDNHDLQSLQVSVYGMEREPIKIDGPATAGTPARRNKPFPVP